MISLTAFSSLVWIAIVLSCLCPVVLAVMFLKDLKKRQLW